MTKKLAMKWVKALRSGKFKQTTGTLHKTEQNRVTSQEKLGFCCLGVLAKVCRINDNLIDDFASLDDPYFSSCQVSHNEGRPTIGKVSVRTSGSGNEFLTFDSLALANDKGATFRSIASWIEKNYKRL